MYNFHTCHYFRCIKSITETLSYAERLKLSNIFFWCQEGFQAQDASGGHASVHHVKWNLSESASWLGKSWVFSILSTHKCTFQTEGKQTCFKQNYLQEFSRSCPIFWSSERLHHRHSKQVKKPRSVVSNHDQTLESLVILFKSKSSN